MGILAANMLPIWDIIGAPLVWLDGWEGAGDGRTIRGSCSSRLGGITGFLFETCIHMVESTSRGLFDCFFPMNQVRNCLLACASLRLTTCVAPIRASAEPVGRHSRTAGRTCRPGTRNRAAKAQGLYHGRILMPSLTRSTATFLRPSRLGPIAKNGLGPAPFKIENWVHLVCIVAILTNFAVKFIKNSRALWTSFTNTNGIPSDTFHLNIHTYLLWRVHSYSFPGRLRSFQ